MDYRTRIFERYVSRGAGAPAPPSVEQGDRWASSYEVYLRGWLPDRRDAAIVDLACGPGRLLRFFAQRGHTDVRGVDISAEQVALARRLHPNVEQGDVLEFLEKHPASFDFITALDLIEHLPKADVLPFLDGCFRALRPGGRLVLQTPNGGVPWGLAVRYADFTHEVCFTPESLRWLMGLAGFERVEARETGPAAGGVITRIRRCLWRVVRLGHVVYNRIETGGAGSGVFTRVFLCSGVRP